MIVLFFFGKGMNDGSEKGKGGKEREIPEG